jgi:hypothetical protein
MVVILAKQVYAECMTELCFRTKSSGANWHRVLNDILINKNPALDKKQEKLK